MSFLELLLALIPFYLMGVFPTGRIIAKARGINLETSGSGNIGATNVARVIGRNAGLLTLLMDVVKGALAVRISQSLSTDTAFHGCVALTVVAGHTLCLPGLMKGGKGVATGLGVFLGLNVMAAVGALIIFLLAFLLSRIVSLSSVVAALFAPIISVLTGEISHYNLSMMLIALLIVFRHHSNLRRLAAGKERRLVFKK